MNITSIATHTPENSPNSSPVKRKHPAPMRCAKKIRLDPTDLHQEIEMLVSENNRNALLKIQGALGSECPEIKAVGYLWSGILRLRNLWLPKNEEKALDFLEKALHCGSDKTKGDAHFEIGTYLRFSEKYAEALPHLEKAKEVGNPRAAESVEAVSSLLEIKSRPATSNSMTLVSGFGDRSVKPISMERLYYDALLEIEDPNRRESGLEKLARVALGIERPFNADAAIRLAEFVFTELQDVETTLALVDIAERAGERPHRAKAFLIRGYCLLSRKEFSASESAFRQAASLGKGEVRGLALLEVGRRLLIDKDLPAEAEEHFKLALEFSSKKEEARVRFYLGLALKHRDPKAAKEEFSLSYEKGNDPEKASAALELGFYLMGENPSEAFRLFEKAVKNGDAAVRLLANVYRISMLAEGYGVPQDPEMAIKLFKSLPPKGMKSLAAAEKMQLGNTLLILEKHAEALELITELESCSDEDCAQEAHFLHGRAYYKGTGVPENHEKALDHFGKVLPANDELFQSAQSFMGLICFYGSARIADWRERAMSHFFNVSLGRNPTLAAKAHYYLMLLNIQAEPRNRQEIERHFHLARDEQTPQIEGLASYDYGMYLFHSGEPEEARRCFERAFELGIEEASTHLETKDE